MIFVAYRRYGGHICEGLTIYECEDRAVAMGFLVDEFYIVREFL